MATTEIPAGECLAQLRAAFTGQAVLSQKRTIELMNVGPIEEDEFEEFSASVRDLHTRIEQELSELKAEASLTADVPDASFPLTEFVKPVEPRVMEAGAALIAATVRADAAAGRAALPTFLVSVGMRGNGALAQAVAALLGVPYSLTNWYPDGSIGDKRVDRCVGIGGPGWIYLNGVPPDARVVVVMDVMRTGVTTARLVQGVRAVAGADALTGVYVLGEVLGAGGREWIRSRVGGALPLLRTFVDVSLDGEVSSAADGAAPKWAPAACPCRGLLSSAVSLIKRMPAAEVAAKTRRVTASFVDVPIVFNPNVSYPYCFFALTDFKPALDPALVEDMADLCVYMADFARCDVLVSEGDRGGGPLLQAISVRTLQPYVIASWTLDSTAKDGGVASRVTQVGFSGSNSQLSLNGLRPGMRCTFVDDMLSSGGTAEAVLGCVERMGATVVEGVFLSEKLYPAPGPDRLPVRKGKERLEKVFKDTVITCVVQFLLSDDKTVEPPNRVGN